MPGGTSTSYPTGRTRSVKPTTSHIQESYQTYQTVIPQREITPFGTYHAAYTGTYPGTKAHLACISGAHI